MREGSGGRDTEHPCHHTQHQGNRSHACNLEYPAMVRSPLHALGHRRDVRQSAPDRDVASSSSTLVKRYERTSHAFYGHAMRAALATASAREVVEE